MKVIFLSNFYPKCRRDHYFSRSKSGLAAAADAHQYALALGLRKVCPDFSIVNSPSIFSYPLHYKDMKIPTETIEENGLFINNVGFCTIMEYQFYSRYHNIYAKLKEMVKMTNDCVYILVYATNISFLKAATKIKSEFKNVKINLIVPDLPEDMPSHCGLLFSLIKQLRESYFNTPESYYKYFDSFVLLTEYMKEKIGCSGNYIVNEGVYEEDVTRRIPHKEDPNIFTLFYGGMLYQKFGIINLVNAVHSINDSNVILELCGTGDCVDYVKSIAKIDNRIRYLGVISREEALSYQSRASLLVNPRIPDGNPFTRYSFPSKTLEYFASGTPTLLYQLDGIPKEYFKYCYSLDSNHTSQQDLSEKIVQILSIPEQKRLQVAESARKFVLENKNPLKAAIQIMDLLNRTV